MKLIIIFCVISYTSASLGYLNKAACNVDKLQSGWNHPKILDTDTGIIATISDLIVDQDDITITHPSELIDVIADGTSISIHLKAAFGNFEETMKHIGPNDRKIIEVKFTACEKPVQFKTFAYDTNNHKPKFIGADNLETNNFIFKLPMPFPKKIPVELFGSVIRAYDVDFTNDRIDFKILPNDYFDLIYKGPDSNDSLSKTHIANLVTKKSLQFSKSETFKIIATDHGRDPGPESVSATITIEIDDDNSVVPTPTPTFSSNYYTGSYEITDSPLHVVTIDSVITVTDGETADYVLEETEYQKYFEITPPVRGILQIVLKENFPEEMIEIDLIPLTLLANIDRTQGKTVIILKMPPKVITTTEPPTTTEVTTTSQSTTVSTTTTGSSTTVTTPQTTITTPGSSTTLTTPSSGTTISTPSSGTTITTPSSGTTITTPGSGTTLTTPSSGTTITTPSSGTTITTPSSGTTKTTPGSGTTITTPSSGTTITTPSSGTTITTPSSGTTITTPGSGTTLTTPSSGTTITTPSSGTTITTPSSGTTKTTPGSGTTITTPSSGTTITTPSSGTTITTPSSGTTITTPGSGTTLTSPSSGTSITTPSSGTTITTPGSGTTLTTPEGGVSTSTTTEATTGPTPIPGELWFDPPLYTISIKPSQDKIMETITAKTTVLDPNIVYDLLADEGTIPNGITYNSKTSTITVNAILTTGTYYLKINAVETKTGKTAVAYIVVISSDVDVCDRDIFTKNAVSIIKKSENMIHYDLLVYGEVNSKVKDKYEYVVVDQYPKTTPYLFTINETGNLQSSALDREDQNLFENVKIPQFTVTVELQLRSEESVRNRRSIMNTKNIHYDEFGLVEGVNLFPTIRNIPRRTVLVVIIEDENDEAPVFAENKIIACYPEEKLLNYVMPTYLTQVHATDIDAIESTYGDVTYSTDSQAFYVHPKTGMIYPRNNIYQNTDYLKFNVKATDGGGKASEMEIEVKLLSENEISVLSLPNIPLEDLDVTMQKLSIESGLTIRAISAISVPSIKTSEYSRSIDNYYMKVYAYGLNGEDIISTNNVQEKLKDAEYLEISSFTPPDIAPGPGSKDETSSNVGYIVGIAVLAVLLAFVLCGGIAFWYFKLRNKNDGTDYYEEKLMTSSLGDDEIDKSKPPSVQNVTDASTADASNLSIKSIIYDSTGYTPPKSPKSKKKTDYVFKPAPKSSFTDVPQRRSTGFVFNPPAPSPEQSPIESRKNSFSIAPPETELQDIQYESNEDVTGLINQSFQSFNAQTSAENSANRQDEYDQRKSVSFNSAVQKFDIEKDAKTDSECSDTET